MPEAAEHQLEEIVKRYPSSKSAIMPALYLAQEVHGWLTEAAFAWVAERLSLPPAHVKQVATFYTMYYKKPVGRYHIQVCRTLSCMLCGSRGIVGQIQSRLGLRSGDISADGMWSYEEVECLGSCGTAPMVQINDVFFENLTAESFDMIIDRIRREQPDLRYSTIREELGNGLPDHPRSQVW